MRESMDRSSENIYQAANADLSGDAPNVEAASAERGGFGSFVQTGHREGEDAFGAGLDCMGEDGGDVSNDQGQDENI